MVRSHFRAIYCAEKWWCLSDDNLILIIALLHEIAESENEQIGFRISFKFANCLTMTPFRTEDLGSIILAQNALQQNKTFR